ncbi:MAG: hypothetical protein H7321_08815 [Bacteroidia bacterium]|nr:hypothetical protein [Bacteroidia bacterium]
MDQETKIETVENRRSNGKTIVIVILGLLLAGSAISNYIFWDKAENASLNFTRQEDTLKITNSMKDSLQELLAIEQSKVAQLRLEISMWETGNDSLMQIINEKEQRIASIRSQIAGGGSSAKMRALKDSIMNLGIANSKFKTDLQELLLQNEDYKARFEASESTNQALTNTNVNLTKKVEIASEPFIGTLSIVPARTKKGVMEPVTKAKKVEYLSISFDLLQNSLTEKPVEKEYIIRILDPNNVVLSTTNSSLVDSDDVFSVKETATFDGKLQKIRLKFTQAPAYKKGSYKAELKVDGVVKQTTKFELL